MKSSNDLAINCKLYEQTSCLCKQPSLFLLNRKRNSPSSVPKHPVRMRIRLLNKHIVPKVVRKLAFCLSNYPIVGLKQKEWIRLINLLQPSNTVEIKVFGITVLKCSKRSFSIRTYHESTGVCDSFCFTATTDFRSTFGGPWGRTSGRRFWYLLLNLFFCWKIRNTNIEVRSLFLCGALFNLQKLYLWNITYILIKLITISHSMGNN